VPLDTRRAAVALCGGGGPGAGPAEVWGEAFLAGKCGCCRWARRWGGPYIGWSRLRSRLRTFPLADSKNIFGVLAPGAGGGLRVRENALKEGHQACRTKSRLMKASGPEVTSVRLDVEQNQLVSVVVRVGFEIICCKSHEICVFSKMKTERICGHVWREASRWSSFLMMAIRT